MAIWCDRCKRMRPGLRSLDGMTAGFYNVAYGFWAGFANPGERQVCDCCMWKSEKYRLAYPSTIHTCGDERCTTCS